MTIREARSLVKLRFQEIREISAAIDSARYDNGRGGTTGGRASGHAQVPDPTAWAGIKAAEDIKYIVVESGRHAGDKVDNPLEWMELFSVVYDNFRGTKTGKVMLRRFWMRENWKMTCASMNRMSQSTYYSCEAEICECGIIHGAQKKLFEIDG